MKLYGSLTSPYARKLRLLFSDILKGSNLDFVVLDIYQKDRDKLREISPVLKIPVLQDNGESLFDSRVIFNHFVGKGLHPKLDWKRENLLTIIDGAMDSLINRFLLKRSNIELDPKSVLSISHTERLTLSFAHLEKATAEKEFENWDYVSMSLFCLLDWVAFRELYDLKPFSSLVKFHSLQIKRPSVIETDPRKSV